VSRPETIDLAGPLVFRQRRWSGGPSWRRVWIRLFLSPAGATVQAFTKRYGSPVGGAFLTPGVWSDCSYGQKEGWVMHWVRKLQRPTAATGGSDAAVDSDWMRDLPAVHEHLVARLDADGAVRRTGTLTVFAEDGSWKCYLNNRADGCSLCASGDTIASALCALETLLEAADTPWRWQEAPASRGQRRRGRGA